MDGGTPLTVTGSGFAAAGETIVMFGTQGVSVVPTSDTRIDLTVPSSQVAGTVDVRVVNANGSGLLARGFDYTQRAPSLTFKPGVGHYELGLKGTRITLTFQSFAAVTSSTTVSFGATAASSVTFVDSRTLIAEVPAGVTTGTLAISATEQGRTVTSQPTFLAQGNLAYGDLTVNEFCAWPGGIDTNGDGAGDSSADEFVELINTTPDPIDLSYLVMLDSTGKERHRFPNPTTVPAGGVIVVFGAGTPMGFKPAHESPSAQAAVHGTLALNNNGDTIELRTLPRGNPSGTTIFMVQYTSPPGGGSFNNPNDGKRMTSNPATSADYIIHSHVPGAVGTVSPGKRVDGSDF